MCLNIYDQKKLCKSIFIVYNIYFKVESNITEKNITKLHVYITNNLNMSYLSTIGQVAPYFTVHLSQLKPISLIQYEHFTLHYFLPYYTYLITKVIIFLLENGKFEFSRKKYIFLKHSKREFCAEFYYHF